MTNSFGVIHTGALKFDIAAREAEVVGERQRIEPLAIDEISGEAKQLLVDLGKSVGRGDEATELVHIPAVIATMLHHQVSIAAKWN